MMRENVIVECGGGTDDYVDYQLMQDGEPFTCVEAKSFDRTIVNSADFDVADELRPVKQLRRYIRTTGSQYGVLTNGEQYVIYENVSDDKPDEELVLSANLGQLPEHIDKLNRISPDM